MEKLRTSNGLRAGQEIINRFFASYRDKTIINGKHSIQDWIDKYEGERYVQSLITYKMYHGKSYSQALREAFQIYSTGGSVSMFPPSEARRLYLALASKSILDPCAGWGGRCLAAMALGLDYVGFDTNLALARPYEEMISSFVGTKPEDRRVRIIFKDSSLITVEDVPGSIDTVFTSPPYWSSETVLKERYEYMPMYANESDFNKKYLEPMVRKTWDILIVGGHYCINTNESQYETLTKIIGRESDMRLKLRKTLRGRDDMYKEYIYIWKKTSAV